MNYTSLYNELKCQFDPEKRETILPGGIKITNLDFASEQPSKELMNPEDINIRENMIFRYPVFSPPQQSSKAILMLHGLNERSWTKYLAWAYRLCELTGSNVILFPLSFHINRSPREWGDPRSMMRLVGIRNSTEGRVSDSSFANVALSKRLSDDPMRFFYSGYQTGNDIAKLISTIRTGNHAVIDRNSRVDIFAYSIGAFLSQILLISDPGDMLKESRLFIFCGGSVFSSMYGSSRFIMDKKAYNVVYKFFLEEFEGKAAGKNGLKDLVFSSRTGTAFRAMIDFDRLLLLKNNIVSGLHGRIKVTGLKKDRVFPATGIIDTCKRLKLMSNVKILDFMYPYSHENPFPVMEGKQGEEVNSSFERIFQSAALFLR